MKKESNTTSSSSDISTDKDEYELEKMLAELDQFIRFSEWDELERMVEEMDFTSTHPVLEEWAPKQNSSEESSPASNRVSEQIKNTTVTEAITTPGVNQIPTLKVHTRAPSHRVDTSDFNHLNSEQVIEELQSNIKRLAKELEETTRPRAGVDYKQLLTKAMIIKASLHLAVNGIIQLHELNKYGDPKDYKKSKQEMISASRALDEALKKIPTERLADMETKSNKEKEKIYNEIEDSELGALQRRIEHIDMCTDKRASKGNGNSSFALDAHLVVVKTIFEKIGSFIKEKSNDFKDQFKFEKYKFRKMRAEETVDENKETTLNPPLN